MSQILFLLNKSKHSEEFENVTLDKIACHNLSQYVTDSLLSQCVNKNWSVTYYVTG